MFGKNADFDEKAAGTAFEGAMHANGTSGATHGPVHACGSLEFPAFHTETTLPDGTVTDVLVEYNNLTGNIRYEVR